jgi:hypothetical protein
MRHDRSRERLKTIVFVVVSKSTKTKGRVLKNKTRPD